MQISFLRRKNLRYFVLWALVVLFLLIVLNQTLLSLNSTNKINAFLIQNGFYVHLRNIENFIIALRYSNSEARRSNTGIRSTSNSTEKILRYRIPKVCYQTWMTNKREELSSQLQSLLRWNKKLNPDIDFQLWNDTEIDVFIRNEFPHHVYSAFKALNPLLGAAKADFFRYCIIYKRGGIYLDLKSSIKIPGVFGNIIKPNDDCILDIRRLDKEEYRSRWGYGSYEQWFLVYSPRHPYLKYMIDRMTRSIHANISPFERQGGKRETKSAVLRLTGPDGPFQSFSSPFYVSYMLCNFREY